MNFKRIFRSLLCLLLVCSLLIGVSPIRAEAVAAPMFALVSGLTVLGSCLIGLGLAAGDNQEAFYEVCTMIAQHPKILPYFDADGNIKIPRFGLEEGELSPWMIPAVLIQAIRGALGELGILNDAGEPLNSYDPDRMTDPVYYNGHVLPRFVSSTYSYYVIYLDSNNDYRILSASVPMSLEYVNDSGVHRFYNRGLYGSYYHWYLSLGTIYELSLIHI